MSLLGKYKYKTLLALNNGKRISDEHKALEEDGWEPYRDIPRYECNPGGCVWFPAVVFRKWKWIWES